MVELGHIEIMSEGRPSAPSSQGAGGGEGREGGIPQHQIRYFHEMAFPQHGVIRIPVPILEAGQASGQGQQQRLHLHVTVNDPRASAMEREKEREKQRLEGTYNV